ncbi:MAG TPA: hypothetical protein PKC30_10165 [Saprospiraceae bacterium]|nr:hypothetical protein [Saprospiraceae bacterium]
MTSKIDLHSLLLIILVSVSGISFAQSTYNEKWINENDPPYREILPFDASATAGNVFARMIDGLGFRFYWATYDLQEVDLHYRLTEESRSTSETIDHIGDLTWVIYKAIKRQSHIEVNHWSGYAYSEKRTEILKALKIISDTLKESDEESITTYTIDLTRGSETISIPFWNLINGPVSDAIWHTGQIASYRRASGNPLPPGIRFLTGTVQQ